MSLLSPQARNIPLTAVLPWKLSRRGTRGEPPSRSMEVILLPKRSSGPHGVRLGVDEIALSCMLLVLSRRGEDATLPSTIPTSTYGPALHWQAARPRGGLLSKYGDSYKSTTKRESIGPSTIFRWPLLMRNSRPLLHPPLRGCRHASFVRVLARLDPKSGQPPHGQVARQSPRNRPEPSKP